MRVKNLEVNENRTGLYSVFDCIGGLVFSHSERTNQYLFLFQIWKQRYQRQKDCATLVKLLLWTVESVIVINPSWCQRERTP